MIGLFTPAATAESVTVYALIVLSAYSGIARKGNAIATLLFVATLIGAIVDARLSPIFAVVAGSLILTQRPA